MVYHERMGRSAGWVEKNIRWFCDRVDIEEGTFPKVWTIVQAHDDPGIISGEDFETVLRGGLAGAASGVMMFTTHSVAEDEDKIEVMKNVYTRVPDFF